MANIKKFGEAVVITSEAKLEDLKKIAKYAPAALVLKETNEDGVKEEVFRVVIASTRAGSISKYGAEFGGCDENGYAQITMDYVGPETGVKEALADSVGPWVVQLNRIEEGLDDVLRQIDRNIADIMSSIEVG